MKSGGRAKSAAVNCILLLVSLGIALLVAELGLRSLEHRKTIKSPKLLCQYDPYLGWAKIPNAEGWFEMPEYKIYEKINSKGLRGPGCPYEKPPGEYRILFLGDSFCEGYSVALDQLFTQRLQVMLNERTDGPEYRTINGGTGGYSTDQELLFFRSEGIKYKPDLVVLMFYENDIWFNNQRRYWRGYKPLFKLEGQELVLTNVPVPAPAASTKSSDNERQLTLKQWLNKNSRVYSFIRKNLKRLVWLNDAFYRLGLAQKPAEIEPQKGTRLPPQFKVWHRRPPPEIVDAWRITEALIAQLKLEVEAAGGQLVLFYIPNKGNIYGDARADTMEKYALSEVDYDLQQPAKDLQKVCERQSIPFIDPTERFREEAGRLDKVGERLYFKIDSHWTAEGHDLAAEILLSHIMAISKPETHATRDND